MGGTQHFTAIRKHSELLAICKTARDSNSKTHLSSCTLLLCKPSLAIPLTAFGTTFNEAQPLISSTLRSRSAVSVIGSSSKHSIL